MYCSRCGKELPEGTRFCTSCGAPQQEEAASAPPLVSAPVKKKKPLWKRSWFWLLVILVIGAVTQAMAANSEKQEALISYINKDVHDLAKIEENLLDSYNSVTGSSYTNDYALYQELNDTTLPLCHELNEKADEIVPEDQEIADVHRIYQKAARKYLNAVAMAISAVKTGNSSDAVSANEQMEEAEDLGRQFVKELQQLAEERNVTFEG